MSISGNHQFQNFTNNGNTQVMPRTFNPDGSPAQLMLMDLAAFDNIQQNANMGFTGQHQIKNLTTGNESNTQFNDQKDGQFSQVGNVV